MEKCCIFQKNAPCTIQYKIFSGEAYPRTPPSGYGSSQPPFPKSWIRPWYLGSNTAVLRERSSGDWTQPQTCCCSHAAEVHGTWHLALRTCCESANQKLRAVSSVMVGFLWVDNRDLVLTELLFSATLNVSHRLDLSSGIYKALRE